jgi:predicted CXXCH cytochrome family protein
MMKKLDSSGMQEKCQWMALAGSLVAIAVTLTLTFLWPSASRALYATTQQVTSDVPASYQSPQQCRECHASEFQAWSGTTHSDATFDPIFQMYLQEAQRPGECYSCHTTGYNSVTGQFALAGVTCEACHGAYQDGHLVDTMLILAPPEELCGTCHTSTLAEWQSSRHGAADVTCTDCHEVHSQKTRVADNTNSLCAGCHQGRILDPTHAAHDESGVYCIDCHLARDGNDKGSVAGGQVGTGHAFSVFVKTCADCHPTPLQP